MTSSILSEDDDLDGEGNPPFSLLGGLRKACERGRSSMDFHRHAARTTLNEESSGDSDIPILVTVRIFEDIRQLIEDRIAANDRTSMQEIRVGQQRFWEFRPSAAQNKKRRQ